MMSEGEAQVSVDAARERVRRDMVCMPALEQDWHPSRRGMTICSLAMIGVAVIAGVYALLDPAGLRTQTAGKGLTVAGIVMIVAGIVLVLGLGLLLRAYTRRDEDGRELKQAERAFAADAGARSSVGGRIEARLLLARGVWRGRPAGIDVEFWLDRHGPDGPRVLVASSTAPAIGERPADIDEETDLSDYMVASPELEWTVAFGAATAIVIAINLLLGNSVWPDSCGFWAAFYVAAALSRSKLASVFRSSAIAGRGEITAGGLFNSVTFNRSDSVLLIKSRGPGQVVRVIALRRDGASQTFGGNRQKPDDPIVSPAALDALLWRWSGEPRDVRSGHRP